MRRLMIPCCLWLSATLLHAGEGSGNWRSETISEYSLEAIAKIRKNLEERAAHLEEVLGTKPELDFQYFSGVLTEEEAELDQRFREGRLSRRATEEHALEFVADFERIRKSLLPLEEKARAKWRESAEAVEAKNGKIFDVDVSAGRLGVILDNSPSMTPYLEQVRTEIQRDFASSYTLEIDGSFLREYGYNVPAVWLYAEVGKGQNPFGEGFLWDGLRNANNLHQHYYYWTQDNVSAIVAMARWMKMDAIYWFCDFDDDVDDEAVELMAKAVLENEVKLYVHTLKKRPPGSLVDLIEESGGELIRKRLKN